MLIVIKKILNIIVAAKSYSLLLYSKYTILKFLDPMQCLELSKFFYIILSCDNKSRQHWIILNEWCQGPASVTNHFA